MSLESSHSNFREPSSTKSQNDFGQIEAKRTNIHISEELAAIKSNVLKENEINMAPQNESPEEIESFLVTYTLPGKSRSKKMLFNYELVGRNGKSGLLQAFGGGKVTSGCVVIPAGKSDALDEFLKKHEIDFSKIRLTIHE